MAKTNHKSNRYDASTIQVLEGLDPVKKRPAMYIGDTSEDGFHHLLTEIINNSVDEALAGYASKIWVIFNQDGSATVIDNGRGIPVDEITKYKKSALEIVMTTLHAGGKFGTETYKVSGGLHGVGSSVVNALSEWCYVVVKRNNRLYYQKYKRGEPQTKVEELKLDKNRNQKTDKTKPSASRHLSSKINLPSFVISLLQKNPSGTIVSFKPDSQVFKEVHQFQLERIKNQLRNYAFLTAGLQFYLWDNRTNKNQGLPRVNQYSFYFEGGTRSFVRYLNRNRTAVQTEPFHVAKDTQMNHGQEINVEVAIQYNNGFHEDLLSFANNIQTREGGSHETGFKAALTRTINDYARKKALLKSESKLSAEDVREGLSAIISIKMAPTNLQFEGQTKTKLGNAEVRPAVESIVREALATYLMEHPNQAQAIIQKSLLAQEARVAAKKARETVQRKGALISSALPGKLADCQQKDPAQSELYVVEGDSAAGPAKIARDRKFQAILPLTGKPINAEKARLDKVLSNEKLKDLLIALGSGVGDEVNLEKLRYHRIILMNDADVDGEHITTLILTFFFRQLRELLEQGYVYVAQPPLYRIQKGKQVSYVYSDEERDQLLSSLAPYSPSVVKIQRFKGLGEMNPEQLWETTMNPKTRILKKVEINNAAEADATFTMLMGEKVPPRRQFIQAHAKQAAVDV